MSLRRKESVQNAAIKTLSTTLTPPTTAFKYDVKSNEIWTEANERKQKRHVEHAGYDKEELNNEIEKWLVELDTLKTQDRTPEIRKELRALHDKLKNNNRILHDITFDRVRASRERELSEEIYGMMEMDEEAEGAMDGNIPDVYGSFRFIPAKYKNDTVFVEAFDAAMKAKNEIYTRFKVVDPSRAKGQQEGWLFLRDKYNIIAKNYEIMYEICDYDKPDKLQFRREPGKQRTRTRKPRHTETPKPP